MRHSTRKMPRWGPMRSERPKRGTEAGQSSAIFFSFFIVLLGIGPRERSRALVTLWGSAHLEMNATWEEST